MNTQIIGRISGKVQFWANGEKVFAKNDVVEATSVELPTGFASEELGEDGKPVFKGYLAEHKFVSASFFVEAMKAVKAPEAGETWVEIPVLVVERETVKSEKGREYDKFTLGVDNGVHCIAWGEMKFIKPRDTVEEGDVLNRFRTRMGAVKSATFPRIEVVERARRVNGGASRM